MRWRIFAHILRSLSIVVCGVFITGKNGAGWYPMAPAARRLPVSITLGESFVPSLAEGTASSLMRPMLNHCCRGQRVEVRRRRSMLMQVRSFSEKVDPSERQWKPEASSEVGKAGLEATPAPYH
ncbi:hypothetical protein QBC47DRAFT_61746 [Echria macrotheca]|uniref:Uncharacterized protein n=1 Tax=Echria macrotheca TaxID=438768 RepID=A0AAJ0B915_9PEZI|nr:hypothetical protein QBC47DRAFT_61746 [Echria macrotheca]